VDIGHGQVSIVDDGVNTADVDTLVRALNTINVDHYKVHEGDAYSAIIYDADVDTGSPKYVRCVSPNTTTRIHIKFSISSDTAGLGELFENPTINPVGSAVAEYNQDRNSANTATLVVTDDPTVAADGTRLATDVIGAGGPTKLGGNSRSGLEWILLQNEEYIVKFTPDANDARVAITLEWYEV
jgi:hypothetical protein